MPKAAVITHGRLIRSMYYNGKIVLNVKPTDTIYVPLPFFHTNALALSWLCIFTNGASAAIRRKFSASNFWDDVRKHNATNCCYVGEICRYLLNQPIKPDDSDNPLKKIIGNGLRPDIWKDFKERFGISKVYEIYGAAESNLYFVNILNLDCTVGMCRLPYAIVQYDIDEDEPIRGENVSTTEVEKVADTFHHVSMSTTYGVVMPGGEGRAGMVAIVLVDEVEELDTKAIAGHFQRNLPSYAVPKFIRVRTGWQK